MQHDDSVLPRFLSQLAGKAGGLSFLVTSVRPLGYMANLSEKVGGTPRQSSVAL